MLADEINPLIEAVVEDRPLVADLPVVVVTLPDLTDVVDKEIPVLPLVLVPEGDGLLVEEVADLFELDADPPVDDSLDEVLLELCSNETDIGFLVEPPCVRLRSEDAENGVADVVRRLEEVSSEDLDWLRLPCEPVKRRDMEVI